MHILFLSDNYPPEVNAPASRTFEHCREWVRAGHSVTVITCVPNFPKGEVYEGYRNRPWQQETQEGIRVIRVWSYVTANAGFGKRILDYQSFMVTATLAAAFIRQVDVVVGTSPQFFTVCAAYVVSRLKRIPFVFELRDLWPESIKAVGAMQDSVWLARLERLELFLYRKATKIISVTRSFRQNLIGRGIDGAKISVVTNGVDTTRFRPHARDTQLIAELGLRGAFVAGYIGTHGLAHNLETLLEAARRLREYPQGQAIRILFLGDGANKAKLIEQARTMALDNVVFIDSVPKDDVVRYWSLLDVSIIHLKKAGLFTSVIPSKLFECMGMGIPVLHGVAGESAEIVERERCGQVFEPENVDQLVAGLLALQAAPDLCQQYRKNGVAAAGRYDRREQALKMLQALADAATGESRGAREIPQSGS